LRLQEERHGALAVVVDGSSISFVDSIGLKVLIDVLLREPPGLHVVLADPTQSLLAVLERAGIVGELGELQVVLHGKRADQWCRM
jgi:hypothetical protein